MGKIRNKQYTEDEIVQDYVTHQMGIDGICTKYHLGKKKVKEILFSKGVELKKRGGQSQKKVYIINDISKDKFPPLDEDYEYIAKCKIDGKIFKDYLNKSGALINHLRKIFPELEIPSDWKRLEIYKTTGIYWWEEYYDVIPRKKDIKTIKKCPYCDWFTYDIENKSGAFEQHLMTKHNISKIEYISQHPEDKEYFTTKNKSLQRELGLDETKYVTCAICGKKFARIDWKHLASHGISKIEYIKKYGSETVSTTLKKRLAEIATENNMYHIKPSFISKGEIEIMDFIKSHSIECDKNRNILKGQEIDIFIPSMNIGIEFNGNKWHTEWWGGKDRMYHLNKTLACNAQNIGLIQIFEDEFHYKKEIVFQKLAHILKIKLNLPKIMGRKCQIHNIDKSIAEEFLSQYHIQGFTPSSVYLGAYYQDILIAVMSFKEEEKGTNKWELNRFASNYNYICQGVGGKLFKYFINHYNPLLIKSFADRRWTINKDDNLYTKLGFTLKEELKPDYRYYNNKIDRYERFHKFNFRKSILIKKYQFDANMTESEMVQKLGYDRIWDCGLLKYVWTNN